MNSLNSNFLESRIPLSEIFNLRNELLTEAPDACNRVDPDVVAFFQYDTLKEYFSRWDKDYPRWEEDKLEITAFWHEKYLPIKQLFQEITHQCQLYIGILEPITFFNFLFESGLYINDLNIRTKNARAIYLYWINNSKHSIEQFFEPWYVEESAILISLYPPSKTLQQACNHVLATQKNFPLEVYGKLFSYSQNSDLKNYLKIGISYPQDTHYWISYQDIVDYYPPDSQDYQDWLAKYQASKALEVLVWIQQAKSQVSLRAVKKLLINIFQVREDKYLDQVLSFDFDAQSFQEQIILQNYQEIIEQNFNEVTTIEELKQVRNKLSKQHHPDLGGNSQLMQYINQKYDSLIKVFS